VNKIAEKLRQAYHNDLTDVPLLLEAADEIDQLSKRLEEYCGKDPKDGQLPRLNDKAAAGGG